MNGPGGRAGPGFPRQKDQKLRGKCPKDKGGLPLSQSEGGAGAKRQRGMPAEAGNHQTTTNQTRKPPLDRLRTRPLSPKHPTTAGEGHGEGDRAKGRGQTDSPN